MQIIFESAFDVLYLITVIVIGVIMVVKSKNEEQYQLFGIMAIVLGVGDSFHLLPRIYGLLTNGIENNVMIIGLGKFITSITMMVFYVILYHVWQIRYKQNNEGLTFFVYSLAIIRTIICLFPQNEWLSHNTSPNWGIYRNIPFVVLGIVMVLLFYKTTSKGKDKEYRFMPLAIALSFVFYIPVILFANVYPSVSMLMIPKTLAYVFIIVIGYISMKNAEKQ